MRKHSKQDRAKVSLIAIITDSNVKADSWGEIKTVSL